MKSLPALLACGCWLGAGLAAPAAEALHFLAPPKPLAAGAVTEDWPRFLGPANDATSRETKLLRQWDKAGPKRVWELEKGAGFAAPAISGERLVLFHRLEGREVIDCVAAETGKGLWSYAYDAPYQDRYGSGDGPRTGAVIAEGKVYTYGIAGHLHCLDLATGHVLWQHDCAKEFALEPNYFGHGSSPLVLGGRLIVQLGGKDDLCAAAFDTGTGRLLWRARHPWGASYASPIPAKLHGKECVLIFAGGESRPPTGGLLCLDAAAGKVLNATPHRAEIAESVNASSPVVAGDSVFVSESYGSGGELIAIDADFTARSKWKTDHLGIYFMTPVVTDGCLIGCDGQSPRLAELAAYDLATGRELWRNDLGGRFGRCSLLAADGAFLCLGEFGDLAWLRLSRAGATVEQQAKLFNAPDTWTLPALSHGLLYVCQNGRGADGKSSRLICYDLRGE